MPRDLSRFPRVCLVADPSRLGRLVEPGPQQSVVRWDDGNEAIVINGWVRRLGEDDPQRIENFKATDPVVWEEPLQQKEPWQKPEPKSKRAAPPDDLAARLRDAKPRRLEAFAQLNDVWDERYASLPNVGLVRMNVINRLRAKVKKGHEIKWPR